MAEARLKDSGVTTAKQLAELNTERLAAMPGVAAEKAAEYFKAARVING